MLKMTKNNEKYTNNEIHVVGVSFMKIVKIYVFQILIIEFFWCTVIKKPLLLY